MIEHIGQQENNREQYLMLAQNSSATILNQLVNRNLGQKNVEWSNSDETSCTHASRLDTQFLLWAHLKARFHKNCSEQKRKRFPKYTN